MGAPAALRQPPWRSMKKFFKLPFTGESEGTLPIKILAGHENNTSIFEVQATHESQTKT